MPILFQYMVKLSLSFAIMYLFYQLILRRLTFYDHNRWYLFGYSVLCFIVAAINISPILEKSKMEGHDILLFFPSIEKLTIQSPTLSVMATDSHGWSSWYWLLLIIAMGCLVMLLRLCVQLISFKRMVKSARLITDEEIKFYQVNKDIIPFSFGNSIFINQHLHTEVELKEIIKHEFVHVKQRHTADIIWAEVLCILNWYNPFAWLIRKAIRQNLEFIADNKVIENGMDKKQYQYLLLKVIGNNHFSIASNFNFSSLKKRIAMMNKIRSAKLHLIKFLFVLPLIAVLLLAFRGGNDDLHSLKKLSRDEFFGQNPDVKNVGWVYDNSFSNKIVQIVIIKKSGNNEVYHVDDKSSMTEFEKKYGIHYSALIPDLTPAKGGFINVDTVPDIAKVNNKGYFIDLKDNKGNCTVVIRDKGNKEVKKLLLTEWNKNEKYYKELYGEIPSSPKNNDIKKTDTNPENEEVLIKAKIGDYSITAQTIIVEDKKRNGGLDSLSIIGFQNGANSINIKDFNGLVLVNGKEVAREELNKIKPDEILEISVYKKTAIEKYGDKGKNGVILITSKKQTDEKAGAELKIRRINADMDNVLYYINGLESSKEAVELIDPTKIQSIDVLKGKSAEKKYGEKGKNGVIEITIPVTIMINPVEKPLPAPWDIQNVLPGKKKDQC